MRTINIANAAKRDAQVGFGSAPKGEQVLQVLADGQRPQNVRYVKTVAATEALVRQHGTLENLAQAIIDTDPEIDIETVGKIIESPLRIYVTATGEIAYRVRLEQVVYNPDGTQRERRELSRNPANVAVEVPINQSKRTIPKAEAVRRFVFSRSYQLTHTNGLTFDFLYQMADELQREQVLRLVGAGPNGTGALVLTTGGEPYRGFLEGRTDGERYSLILHLSNQELKSIGGAQ